MVQLLRILVAQKPFIGRKRGQSVRSPSFFAKPFGPNPAKQPPPVGLRAEEAARPSAAESSAETWDERLLRFTPSKPKPQTSGFWKSAHPAGKKKIESDSARFKSLEVKEKNRT